MDSATAFTILPSPFMVGGGRRFSKFLWGIALNLHFIYEETEAQRNGMTLSCDVLNCIVGKNELSL